MKTIVITGGSEGLGKAIAKRLGNKFKIVILSQSETKLKTAAEEIGCEYKVCDVTDFAQVEQVVNEITKEHDAIDVLINNAGLFDEGPIEDIDPARAKKLLEVNTLGPLYMTRVCVPHMKRQQAGLVINIGSISGLEPKPNRTVYNTSKFAVDGFTKTLRQELQPSGIGVVGIHPGRMNTSVFKNAGIERDLTDAMDPDEVAKTVEFILNQDTHTVYSEIGVYRI